MMCVRRLARRGGLFNSPLHCKLKRLQLWDSRWQNPLIGLSGHDSFSNVKKHGVMFSGSCGTFMSALSYTVLVQARDPAKLTLELEGAIDERRFSDAWALYEKHLQMMEGFPRKSVVNRLLAGSSESLDDHWLEKSYGLVELAFEEGKQTLFEKETLIYLSLGLAKRGSSVFASTILRRLVEMGLYPSVSCWSAVLAHMSTTANGAYLGAELVIEIGKFFKDNWVDPRKKSNAPLIAMKPNATAFNIALVGCLIFGSSRKAEELLELIPRLGIKADTNMLIVMAHIYERNGRREDLRKLQRYIGEAPDISDAYICQFYNCLLSCHLKLGDLSSASGMVLEMLHRAKEAKNTLAVATFRFDSVGEDVLRSLPISSTMDLVENLSTHDSSIVRYKDFCRDRNFIQMESEAKGLLAESLPKLRVGEELVRYERGILQPTETVYLRLVKAYLEAGNIKDLTDFLIKAEREDCPVSNDDSALARIIDTCITLGWLDRAHDVLDEMRLCGARAIPSAYNSLLKAYCRENRTSEIRALVRDAKKAGIQLDASSYEALIHSRVIDQDNQGALHMFREMKEARLPRGGGTQELDLLVEGCSLSREAGPMSKLLEEITDGQRIESGVHDWNNVIHFFCKKRLMNDAEKALKKMRSLGIIPNAQTFHSMATGYAAIGGKYIEVTELWGQMKSLACATSMRFDQELLDSVLYTFVRGGFFVRANEVVEMMEEEKMFVDKYKYRTLFLKYHKTLYKGKAPKFQTEAQLKKREAALTFKKWLGFC
ncbi:hypothetical protein SAY87_015227 [Trapa incisa]|uniref:Pentatricopeptide repeat-containing protein n=1 Tax=Trapa incisa TaxID=236973 RepID=A0AAN7JDX4_9MYRT|nr:hypothetical protein SAY87_015227 [Trapa incisa]